MDEQGYLDGYRAGWVTILNTCLKHLNIEDVAAQQARWVSEREETIAMLRMICAEHGDNDWEGSLHLADVIEKHLWRHLPEVEEVEEQEAEEN